MKSKLNTALSKLTGDFIKGAPTIIDKKITKGMSGGKVSCDDMKVSTLLSLK